MYNGTEIPVTTPILVWLIVLLIGFFVLWILLLKLLSLQRRTLKLFKEKHPESYKTLLEPKQFKSLGMPNTLFGFPLWPDDSWRQTKFFLSRDCKIEDKEICGMRDKARKLLIIYTIILTVWMLVFITMFLVLYKNS